MSVKVRGIAEQSARSFGEHKCDEGYHNSSGLGLGLGLGLGSQSDSVEATICVGVGLAIEVKRG